MHFFALLKAILLITPSKEASSNKAESQRAGAHAWNCSCIQVMPYNMGPLCAAMTGTESLWRPGDKIAYSYINGTAIQHTKFESCLAVWIRSANLVCERVASGGDVRVEFSNLGSWSYVGNTCKGVTDTKKPTMRLSGIDPIEPRMLGEEQHTILHECGHMLGFLHEHQSPASRLEFTFDDQATVQYYAGTETLETIRSNVLRVFPEQGLSAYSRFDSSSIMLYHIPPEINAQRKQFTKARDLSSLDKSYVVLMYPPPLLEARATIVGALRIADVPPDVQSEILHQTHPEDVRRLFMEWNIRSRAGKKILSAPAARSVGSYLRPDTKTARDDSATYRVISMLLSVTCISLHFIFFLITLFFLISVLSFSVPFAS